MTDPYLETWLRRTGRQLAASGRLTQIAAALVSTEGGTVQTWRIRLRGMLDGGEKPSIELLTRIDALLAGPSQDKGKAGEEQGLLF